jgi:nanoRNase/pAp phosphatase (c-di-AMP/oligoRNAs hydrolase)
MKFKEIVEPLDKKVAIFTHIGPDPDAIASATGLKWLLGKMEIQSDVFYSGEISHKQNQTMVNILSINMMPVEEYLDNKESYSKNVMVDGTPKNLGNNDINIDIIIDHHKNTVKQKDFELVDIREVGSCSSIIYDMIKEYGYFFDNSDEDKVVATALLLGIKIDTNDLLSENTSSVDYTAYQDLSKISDIGKISSILNYPLPKYLFELESESLKEENTSIVNTAYICSLGELPPSRRDALPEISDKLLRMEGISTSIVFAVIGNHLDCSVRSKDVSLDVNSFVQKIFGKEYSGGKSGGFGGARIPLGFFGIEGENTEVKKLIVDAIKAKLMAALQKELSSE